MIENTIIVIPARLKSSRLKEKLLLDIKGKPMLQRVYERALLADIPKVYIATDSQKIATLAQQFTDNIIITSTDHISGTTRIAEAIKNINCKYVINLQGDEPLMDPKLIKQVAKKLQSTKVEIVTAAYPILNRKDILDYDKVKVIFNDKGYAIYFSRLPIPYNKDLESKYYCHIGLYGYSKKFLLKYVKLKASWLEKTEKLEQLRALAAGFAIFVIATNKKSIGVDNKKDFKEICKLF